jgi:hypothetical protein
MATLSKLLTSCCLYPDDAEPTSEEKQSLLLNATIPKCKPTEAQFADEIVAKLLAAQRNDAALQADLRCTVDACGRSALHADGWYDGLVAAVLEGLKRAIELGEEMGPVMNEAHDKAVAAVNKVKEWAEDNPEMAGVIITLIALGVIALLVPWMLTVLGFTESGILEGKSLSSSENECY